MALPETKGASGSTPRQEAVDAINAVWNQCLRADKERPAFLQGGQDPDRAIAAEVGIAQASALLYIGDELRALRAELRDEHERADTEAHRKADNPADSKPARPLAGLFARTDEERQVGGSA